VIDSHDCIRLINESAAQLLGPKAARQEAHLSEVSPRLLQLLSAWRASLAAGKGLAHAAPTFTAADGSRLISAHFVALPATAPAPVIVFLEEPDLLELRAQQSRLAALARLSASIAHEVKNPVHALSTAGQLLAESPALTDEDRRLTQIISTNAERVSRIIDSVLMLSRGGRTRVTHLSLKSWTEEFRQEFCETMQWPLSRLAVHGPERAPEVRADPGQLRQLVWNLCENALRHAATPDREQPVELAYGRLTSNARPFLEVSDRGPGVAPEHVERIFEPFFSRGSGTGMGLYLARELAQTNGAVLLYLARPGGGSTFRIIFTDPRRWEARSA
jgi:two-component system, NtrC family, sensor histidine kinase PilS